VGQLRWRGNWGPNWNRWLDFWDFPLFYYWFHE